MEFFVVQTLSGFSFAAVLFMLASGLSLIFGVMHIVNISHGAYYMLGAYIGLSIYWVTGSFPLAILGGALAIARALMTNPEFLLMDEPGEGLAPLLVKAIGEAILQLKESGLSILMVEQNLPFAIEIADYTYVLGKGEIVYSSTPDELWRNEEVKTQYLGI